MDKSDGKEMSQKNGTQRFTEFKKGVPQSPLRGVDFLESLKGGGVFQIKVVLSQK